MSQPNVTSATVTFRPTVSVAALKTALKQMEGELRTRVVRELENMCKTVKTGN
jgi:hypothetical protein